MKLFSLALLLLSIPAEAQFSAPPRRQAGAVAWVQKAENSTTSSVASLATAAFTAAPTKGNMIVCAVYWNSTKTVSSITDTQSNTYTLLNSLASPSCNTGNKMAIYYAPNIAGGGSSVKVTLALSAAGANDGITCHEFSGVPTIPADTGGSSTTSSTTTSASTSAKTNFQKSFIVAYFMSTQTMTAGSGYTAVSTMNTNLLEWKKTTAPAAATAAPATISTAACYDAIWATFKSM